MAHRFANWALATLAALAACELPAQTPPLETPLWEFVPRSTGPYSEDLGVHADPLATVVWFQRWWRPARATTFTREGERIASFGTCSGCLGFVAAPDGSAWLKQSTGTISQPRWNLVRHDALGALVQEEDLADFHDFTQIELLPNGDGIDLLFVPSVGRTTLRLVRIGLDGSRSLPPPIELTHWDGLEFADHRRNADGSMTALLDRRVGYMCPPIMPCDIPPRVSVFGYAPDGRELWRFEPVWFDGSGVVGRGFDAQGRVWIVRSAAGGARLLIVDTDGTVSDERVVSPEAGSSQFIGPIGEFGMMRNGVRMALIDEQGTLRASRLVSTCYMTDLLDYQEFVITPFGYLLSRCQGTADNFDVTLFDPNTLATRAEFDVDGIAVAYNSHLRALGQWLALPDGTLYAAVADHRGARLARFAIPGTPAHRPFGNGFESAP